MFKRIVSFFLCFVTVLCSFSVTAFADIFDAVRYNLNSLSEFIENLDVHVGTDGAFVEGELGFSAVKWWSALVNGEDSFQDSYNNYVSSLDSPVTSNTSSGNWVDTTDYDAENSTGTVLDSWVYHHATPSNYGDSWSRYVYLDYYFTVPVSGTYALDFGYTSFGFYLSTAYVYCHASDGSISSFPWGGWGLSPSSSGDSPAITYSCSKSYSVDLVAGSQYSLRLYGRAYFDTLDYASPRWVRPYCNVLSSNGSQVSISDSSTRTGALMQAVSNYNSTTNQYNFYLGTADSNGNVTNVYDPAIFNEASMIFTEPVTGQQYQCTGWKYGYASAARGYRLDLAEDTYSYNGKDIRTLCLFYLDDALYVVGLDKVYSDYFNDNSSVNDFFSNAAFIDKYSYVTAEATGEGSETCQHVYTSETITAPTCLDQGVRRYTCTLCGHTRDEKIPATGHAWEVTETVETEVNENGDVTKLGYKVYTCSVCGETYKQYDNTGQPGPPSGGGSVEDESWFSWLGDLFKSLISAIVSGLASGLEYLVDTVIVTVTDLTIQTTQWVFSSLHISDLTTWFVWFDDGNPLFQDEFGQDTEETEVDVWAYSLG